MTSPLFRRVVDAIAIALLLAAGLAGFGASFAGSDHLVAGAVGFAGALLVASAAALLRLGLLGTAGLAVLAYALLGLLATPGDGVAVSPDSLLRQLQAPVTVWKSLLTVEAPASGLPELALAPFIAVLVTGTTALSLAFRARHPMTALVPAAVLLITGVAFGSTAVVAPVAQSLCFALVALAWSAFRRTATTGLATGSSAEDVRTRRALSGRSLVGGALVLLLAGGASVAVAGAATPPGARQTLRDTVVPPLDLRDYPSPLSTFRALVRDQEEAALLTVSGLPAEARVRLATMDAYDGTVLDVAASTESSGMFERAGTVIRDEREGVPATISVTMGTLAGVWLPDAGYLTGVRFTGDRAETLAPSLRYNALTGTAIVTAGLREGDSYSFSAVLPPAASDDEIGEAGPSASPPLTTGVPDAVASGAVDLTADATTPIGRLRALESALSTDGFFSHGLEGEVPSRPGHGAQRLQSLLTSDQWVGDDEQYAVAMALMADSLGLPARVVMGFVPDPERDPAQPVTITGADLHAWVEVGLSGAGWVVFDPTPPEDQVPQDQSPQPRSEPQAQVLQPPPPPQEPAEVPPDVIQEDEDDDEREPDPGWIAALAVAAGGLLLLALILVGPVLLIGALKARRALRRRRADRTADRFSGGWEEVVERAADLGAPVPPGRTRRENGDDLAARFPDAGLATIARAADAEVFGPGEPSEERAEHYWREVDAVVEAMRRTTTRLGRLRATASLRSFRPEWMRHALDESAARRTRTRHDREAAAPDRNDAAAPDGNDDEEPRR